LLDFSLRPIGAAFFGGERSARCEVPRAPRLPVRGFPPRSPALALSRSPPATWPTRGCAWSTRTTTSCAASSTSSARPSRSTRA